MCQMLLKRHYPDVCLVKNVFNLLKTAPPFDTDWDPKKLKIASEVPCCVHEEGWFLGLQ